MKIKNYLILILLFIGCSEKQFNNKKNLNELIDVYIFLSENHNSLHVMMGEDNDSSIESYNTYKHKIEPLKNNFHIQPIIFGLNNIILKNNTLKNTDKFDALVDYYQIGIQIMIEGILKGYGYNDKIPQNSKEYLDIKKLIF